MSCQTLTSSSSKRKRARARIVGLSLAVSAATAALFPQLARAGKNIQVESVTHGSATLARVGRNTTITVSNGAIVNYSVFNIPQGSTVTFVEPSAVSRVLNRIDSNTPSFLNGTLTANGIVYFVNPAGITFGPNAVINVGQLYAAAGNMADSDFLSHIDRFTGTSSLINQGQITAGNVVLAGSTITNSGAIVADKGLVLMTTGTGVYLGESGDPIYVQVTPPPSPSTSSAKASPAPPPAPPAATPSTGVGDMYWTALTNTGSVRASTITMAGGSGAVNVSGNLNASGPTGGTVAISGAAVNLSSANVNATGPAGGGTVLIGGGPHGGGTLPAANGVSLDASTVIDADAIANGNGGTIVVWSNGLTTSSAILTARGGPLGGNGGFIETSGNVLQVFTGPNASAPLGKAGTWLLDPSFLDIEIENGANNGQVIGVSVITNGTIENVLDGGTNLEITTDQLGPDAGVLTQDINAGIVVAPTNNVLFTLQANAAATLNGGIVQSGGSNLSVEIDELGTSQITLNAPISIGGTFTSLGGNFLLASGASITAQAVSINNSTTTGGGLTVIPGSTEFDGPVSTVDGDVIIGGTGFTTAGSGSIATNGGNVQINTTGDIVVGANVNTGGGAFSATGNSFEQDAEISDGGIATAGNAFTVDTTSGSGSISLNGQISWTGGTGRNVLIQGNGPITLTSGSEIVSNGATALPVEIDNLASTGLIMIAGSINTTGTYTSDGGNFEIASTGSLSALAAAINTSTTTSNALSVTPGSTTLNGPVTTEGEDFDVGGTTFTSDSAGTITTSGGAAILDLSGAVTVAGAISTNGAAGASGGDAGALDISGAGTLTLSTNLTAVGGAGSTSGGGNGGDILISGFTTNTFSAGIVFNASGGHAAFGHFNGSGGDITIDFGTGDTSIDLSAETFQSARGSGGSSGSGGELFFNGSSSATSFTIPAFNAASATVTGGSANDSAVITGLGPANLTVNLAGGTNTFEFQLALLGATSASLTLQGTTGGTLILDGGPDADAFTITSTTVSLGAGGSYNYSSGQDFTNLEIQGFGGNDTFTINSTSIGTTIYGGRASASLSGNNSFTVNGVSNDPLTLVGDAGTNVYIVNISSAYSSNVILQSSVSSSPSTGNGTDYLAINGTGNLSVTTSGSDTVAEDSAASGVLVDFQSVMSHLAGLLLDSTGAASGSSGSIAIAEAIAIPGAGNGSAVNGISPGISVDGILGTPPGSSSVTFTSPGSLNAGNSPITILAGSNITLMPITTAAPDNGSTAAVVIVSTNGNILDGTSQTGVDVTDSSGSASLSAGGTIGAFTPSSAPLITSLLAINASATSGINLKNTDPGPSDSSVIELVSTAGAVSLSDTGNPTVSFQSLGNATVTATGSLVIGSATSGAVTSASTSNATGRISLTASDNIILSPVTTTAADSGPTLAVTITSSNGSILDGTGESGVDITAVNGSLNISAGQNVGATSPSSLPLTTSVLGLIGGGTITNIKNTDPGPSNSSLISLGGSTILLNDIGNPNVVINGGNATLSVSGTLNFNTGQVGDIHFTTSTNVTSVSATAAAINVLVPINAGTASLVATGDIDVDAAIAGVIFVGDTFALTSETSGSHVEIDVNGTINGDTTITTPSLIIVPTAPGTLSGEVDLIPLISSPTLVPLPVALPSGSLVGTFTLTTAEINAMSAVLKIGTSSHPADGIQILSAVDFANDVGVEMNSSTNITTPDATSATPADLVEVEGSTGSLALTAAGTISVGTQVAVICASAAGSVFIYNSGNLNVGPVGSQAGVVSGSSSVTIDVSPSSTLANSSEISTSSGNITLQADAMNLNAPVNAGSGLVWLQPATSGLPIVIGANSASGELALDGQFSQITAGALLIGNSTAGNVTFAQGAGLTFSIPIVQVASGGSITGGGSILGFINTQSGFATSGSLALSAGTSVDLTFANVTQLAVAAHGPVVFNGSSSGLDVTTIDFSAFGLPSETISGISNGGMGTIMLTNNSAGGGTGAVVVSQPITSGGNAVSISSTGFTNNSTIAAGAGDISITADTLSLGSGSLISGTGTLTVETTNNPINLGSAAGSGAGIQISQANFNSNVGQNFQSITIEETAVFGISNGVITAGALTVADPLVLISNTSVSGAHDIDITGVISDPAGITFNGTVDVPAASDGITISTGSSPVTFLGNVGALGAPASIDITAGSIILGGSAGSSIQMNSSGPMTFNGPVTTGGGSFAMTGGGNVTFADNITSAGGNIGVTSGGNITVLDVSSNGTTLQPNAGNITLQPGTSGNLIFDPSPAVATTTITISANGDGGSNGAISLEPNGFSTIPVAATIYPAYAGNGDTTDLDITGGAITFGKGSRTTVIGNLTIDGSSTVTLSDITVLGQLNVTGSPIVIQTRAAGTQLENNQGQVVPVAGGFTGVGFVAGQGISFSAAPQITGTGASPEFATPGATNVSPDLTGFVIRAFPQAVTIPLLEFESNGAFTILALSPSGTTTTNFASVIAGAVPRQIPQASDDIAASPSQELQLEALGIDARPLSTEQVVGLVIGSSLFNDLPPDVSDNEHLISTSRLYSKAVQDVLSTYDEIFFTTVTDASGKQVEQSQYSQIRDLFVRAQLAFEASHHGTAITPDNFRAFILSDPDQAQAAEKMAQLANLFQKLQALGLNSAEFAKSRDVILSRIAPPGLSAQFMYTMIMGPIQ